MDVGLDYGLLSTHNHSLGCARRSGDALLQIGAWSAAVCACSTSGPDAVAFGLERPAAEAGHRYSIPAPPVWMSVAFGSASLVTATISCPCSLSFSSSSLEHLVPV